MNILKDNLTFAIIVTDGAWRTDLTTRFCEFYGYQLNGHEFLGGIMFPKNIDEAIGDCPTDYLLIQSGGHVTVGLEFYEALGRIAEQNTDIVLGHVTLNNDYATLDKRCLFINKKLWKEHGAPTYTARVRQGPEFRVSVPGPDTKDPFELIALADKERVFVPAEASNLGAGLIIKQLDVFGKVTSMPAIIEPKLHHFLDTRSGYHEIHTETMFEKINLPHIRNQVFAADDDDLSQVQNALCEVVIAPAQGMKPFTLATHFHARKVIVYDLNQPALELQKLIFGTSSPTTFGAIMEDFQAKYPNVAVAGDWSADEYSVVQPLGIEVEFHLVDAVSYQMEDLIKSVDHSLSLVIDFSDIYVYPFNYYRRLLYQVQGLFAELYSLLKSRTGPTYILGFAPGFQSMDTIKVNTSNAQFELDPTIDPYHDEEGNDVEEPPAPIMFKPEISKPIAEQLGWKPPIKKEELFQPGPPNPIRAAETTGYNKSPKLDENGMFVLNTVVLSKTEIFTEPAFTAIFEYTIDESTGAWNFKVGVPGNDKRIEFSNGLTTESFTNHFEKAVKINPTTCSRYFQ